MVSTCEADTIAFTAIGSEVEEFIAWGLGFDFLGVEDFDGFTAYRSQGRGISRSGTMSWREE